MDNDDTVRFAKGYLETKGYVVVPVKEYERDQAAFIALDDEMKALKVQLDAMQRVADQPPILPIAQSTPMRRIVHNWERILDIPAILDWCKAHPGEFKTVRVPSQSDDEVVLARQALRRQFNRSLGRGFYEMTAPDGNSFRICTRRVFKSTRGPRPVGNGHLNAVV